MVKMYKNERDWLEIRLIPRRWLTLTTWNLASPEQIAIWKKMSFEEKYVLFQGLMRTVRKAKEAGVRMQHPEWNDEKVEKELASIYIRSTT